MSSVNILYNSYSLQDVSVAASQRLTTNIQYNQLPDKNISLKQDTIRDGFDILSTQYSQKTITANGWLISDSGSNLKTLIDNFKNNLRPKEQNLDIETYGGSGVYTRWTATTQNIVIPEEHYQITQKPFEVSFLCEPFGKATTSTTINLNSGNNIAASPYNEAISITGTYKAEPVITITVVSETTMTVIKFDNTTTGDWLQVARSFSAGEVLVIDCENETVQVDGTDVDFTGVFIGCDPSTNNITITTTDGGAFTITSSIVYYAQYL